MLDIRSLTRADIPEAAPLVAQFRVTLRGFKGVDSEPDVPAGATELAEYLDAGYPAYLARGDGEAAVSGAGGRRGRGRGRGGGEHRALG